MTLKVFFDNYLSSHQELSLAQIIRDSGLSRTYAHEIINGKKKAGRDRVIALCFAASMSIDETNHALILSQNNPLYPKISRDAVLTMCLQFKHQRNVSFQTITQVNLFLEENGHELLVLSKEY